MKKLILLIIVIILVPYTFATDYVYLKINDKDIDPMQKNIQLSLGSSYKFDAWASEGVTEVVLSIKGVNTSRGLTTSLNFLPVEEKTYGLDIIGIKDGYWVASQKFNLVVGSGCTEDWTCTEWGECKDNNQTRTCTDKNHCGTEKLKPDEVKSCDSVSTTTILEESTIVTTTTKSTTTIKSNCDDIRSNFWELCTCLRKNIGTKKYTFDRTVKIGFGSYTYEDSKDIYSDLGPKDLAVIYNPYKNELFVFYKKEADRDKEGKLINAIRDEFYNDPCSAFYNYLQIFKDSSSEGTKKSCSELYQEAVSFDSLSNKDANKFNLVFNKYETVYNHCKDTIEGARSLLRLAELLKSVSRGPPPEDYFLLAYTNYKGKYNEIADTGLYNYILIKYEKGDCTNVKKYGATYKNEFKSNSARLPKVNDLINKCTPKDKSSCTLLRGDGHEGAMNIIFIPEGYENEQNFLKDVKEGASKGLFYENSIYKNYYNKINVYYVFRPKVNNLIKTRQMTDKNGNSWMDVYGLSTDKITDLTKECPSVYSVVVLSNNRFRSAAWPYYRIVALSVPEGRDSLIYTYGPVITHELGHALFALVDEYVESEFGNQYGQPNCAPDKGTAKSWWGNVKGAGYFQGCSYVSGNIRPYDNTVMRNHWETQDYKEVNNIRIREVMSLFR